MVTKESRENMIALRTRCKTREVIQGRVGIPQVWVPTKTIIELVDVVLLYEAENMRLREGAK